MELHLLRHADAGDPGQWTGPDELRPLSPKGRRQADRLGQHLSRIGYALDLVVTSPKVRARETANRLADPLGLDVIVDERLAQPFGLVEIAEILEAVGRPGRPVLVGHDPDFSSLLQELTGVQGGMVKGAIAGVALELPVAPGAGTLRFLLPPRLLPR